MPNPKVSPPQPPPFWNEVPKWIWRRLELEHVFRYALFAKGQPNPHGPFIALGSLDSYVEAAKGQQRRMKRQQRRIQQWTTRTAMAAAGRPGAPSLSSLFEATHFYLIAWSRVAMLTRFIRTKTKFPRVGRVVRRYHRDFQSRIDGRNHLEHFEQRLPGGPEVERLKLPGDILNMAGHHMTYGGKRLDVGPDSLQLLLTATREFRTALLYDSVQALVDADPASLELLLHRAASDHHLARIQRKYAKG